MKARRLGTGRVAAFAFGFLCVSSAVFAESTQSSSANAPLRMSLSLYPELTFGSAKELVYDGSYLLSELDWPLQPLWSVGTKLSVDTDFGLFAALDLVSGINGSAGYATDSDYLNYNGVKTHFSQSDGYVERALTLDARAGWSFTLLEGLSVGAFARFQSIDVKWAGNDGYYQYPPESTAPYTPWSASEPQVPVYGTAITYEQNFMIPALGLSLRYAPSSLVSFAGSFSYSPFASINDIDNHFLRSLIFYDSMAGCSYLEPELIVTARPIDRLTVTLALSYLSVASRPNGTVTVEDTSTGAVQTAGSGSYSGASIQTLSASLSFDVAF